MDTKRLIIAIALSIVVIVIYQHFFMPKPPPRPQPVESTEQVTAEPQKDKQSPGAPETKSTTPSTRNLADLFSKKKKKEVVEEKLIEPVKEDLKETALKEVVVETDLFTAVFTNEGAGLKSLVLKKYKDDKKLPLDLVSEKVSKFRLYPFHFSPFEGNETFIDLNSQKYVYNGSLDINVTGNQRNQPKEIIFRYKNVEKNVRVYKKFVIYNNSYLIGLEYEIIKDGKELDAPFVFGPDLENNVSEQRGLQMGLKIKAYDGMDDKDIEFTTIRTEPTDDETIEKAEGVMGRHFIWAAYERAYFAAVFKAYPRHSTIGYSVIKEKAVEKDKKDTLYSYIVVTNPALVYMGPKDQERLAEVHGTLKDVDIIIEYGFLGSIAKILLKGINLVHSVIPNYGWAIVVFTIFLKIILFPLTYTSSVSMAKMQTLQPKIKTIKKKYKNMRDPDQRRKMNEETMRLYKQEKVNPASGCLPMLLQLPILFAFFYLLRTCINVRHEPWILWIKDLSLKDPIYLLPILMGITQLIVQKMSPSGAEGAQKKMMYIMPVVITFFVMSLPSGLTLYWFASNLLQIGQQHIINKKIFQKKKEEEKTRKAQKRKKGVKGK
jgi:YidC/Oxa1 family membrane protein insertase